MKSLNCLIILAAMSVPAFSQNVTIGVNCGTAMTRSAFSINSVDSILSNHPVNGFTGGINIKYYLNDRFLLGTGISRLNKGYKLTMYVRNSSGEPYGRTIETGITHTVIPLCVGYYKKLGNRFLWNVSVGGSYNRAPKVVNLLNVDVNVNGSQSYLKDTVIITGPNSVNANVESSLNFSFGRSFIYGSITYSKGLAKTFIADIRYGYENYNYTAQLTSRGSYLAFEIGYGFSFQCKKPGTNVNTEQQ